MLGFLGDLFDEALEGFEIVFDHAPQQVCVGPMVGMAQPVSEVG